MTPIHDRDVKTSLIHLMTDKKVPWLCVVVLGLIISILHIHSLTLLPDWFPDEVLTISRIQSLKQTSKATGALDKNIITDEFELNIIVPNLPYYLQGITTHLYDSPPSIKNIRWPSLFGGFILLIALSLLSLKIWGPYEAVATFFIGITSQFFMHASHLGRPDILAIAMAYSALTCVYFKDRYIFIFAFLAIISLGIHERSIIITIPAALAFMLKFYDSRNKKLLLILSSLGTAIGLTILFLVNVLPYGNLDTWAKQYQEIWGVGAIPLSSNSTTTITHLWVHFIEVLFSANSILEILTGGLLFIVFLTFRHHVISIRNFLPLSLILILGLLLIDRPHYIKIMAFLPVIWLCSARLFVITCINFHNESMAIRLLSKSVFVLVISLFLYNLLLLANVSYTSKQSVCSQDSNRIAEYLKSNINKSSKVIALDFFWLWIPDQFIGTWSQVKAASLKSGKPISKIIEDVGGNIIILDGMSNSWVSDKPSNIPYIENARIPEYEIKKMQLQASMVTANLNTSCIGTIQIIH